MECSRTRTREVMAGGPRRSEPAHVLVTVGQSVARGKVRSLKVRERPWVSLPIDPRDEFEATCG